MRVGILCYPTHGGSGVIASELALHLARAGDDIHVVSHAVPPRLKGAATGVEVHVARGAPYPLFDRAPHELALASCLIGLHEREPFDLLHAHYALPHAVVGWMVRSAAVAPSPKLVTTLHGTDTSLVGAAPEYAPLLRHALRESDAVTAVSAHLAAEAQRAFDLGPGQAPCVIPDFVDVERFVPRTERPAGPLRVLHVSNFRPLKRVPWLVEAFAEATAGGDAELWLVGDGPERELAARRGQELGLGPRLRILGAREDLADLHASADVLALSSEREAFGLVALEAMACGVAVLATAVGGVSEVVRDGVEGRLVPSEDRAGYAQALRELLADAGTREAMGQAGRARAVQQFAAEGVVARYRALYRSLLES